MIQSAVEENQKARKRNEEKYGNGSFYGNYNSNQSFKGAE
jgi:hypothetical protein